MSRFLHGLAHAGLIALQVGQLLTPSLPTPYKVIFGAVIGGIQAGLALYNQGKPSNG